MTQGASIFSAEAFAIAQALKFIYQLEGHPPEVIVYSDSSTAIKTISFNTHSDNAAVATSREQIASLRSSGTLTTLAWIPSHTGINGNETVDRLAANECLNPSGNQATVLLSPSEEISIMKPIWAKSLLQNLKRCQKKCITIKIRVGTTKWHQHHNRQTAICLHKLRTGHHHLNSFRHRIDQEEDPSCRHGCEAIKDSNHALTICQKYETHRQALRILLTSKNLPFDHDTIIGLNPTLDTNTQFQIRDALAKFLAQTGLINLI
jgi:hypothetical protein